MKLSVINKSLLFVFLITALTLGQFRRQPDFKPQFSQRGIYFESIIVPDDSGAICYIPFRISYNSLVFVKEDQKFKAKYSITAEASDSLSKKIIRDIISKEIVVDNYDNTLDETQFSQGMLKIKLPHGNYTIIPLITDVNASRELTMRQMRVRTDSEDSGIFQPILFRTDKACDNLFNNIINYEGQIPFSNTAFDLLIPILDTAVNTIDVEIINNKKSIVKTSLRESSVNNLDFQECRNNIYITNSPSQIRTRNFIFHYVNKDLIEGELELKVVYNKANNKKARSFKNLVRWIDKPFSLINIPFSIRILKYITDEKVVEKLMDIDDEKQYEELFAFWKTMDPTPETAFNELMNEYYERVDYTIKNFSALGQKNGAESDRGKIFIQFGQPDNIKRVYDDPNNIKEIWTYKDPERQFMFTDKTGLGNFILSSNS